MGVIVIESRAFELMQERLERFVARIDELCNQNEEKGLKKWLDNQDVCQILNITKRTIQTYRDNGTLPYTMIGHKAYYKPEDVEQIIKNE